MSFEERFLEMSFEPNFSQSLFYALLLLRFLSIALRARRL